MKKENLQVGNTYLAKVSVYHSGHWNWEVTPCKLLRIEKLSSGREAYHVLVLKTGQEKTLHAVTRFHMEVV